MYKHVLRRVSAVLLVMVLAAGMSAAYALEVPDLNRTGSVSVTLQHEGELVTGGSLAMYQVADAYEDDGNFGFALTDEFKGSGVPLDNLEAADIADELAEYAMENDAVPMTQEIGNDGEVRFDGLNPGVYVVTQFEASDGYKEVNAFLVSLPHEVDGEWVYSVDATPKVEVEKIDVPDTPETPDTPGDEPVDEEGGKIPQTGQLNWPIPVLAIAGIILFAIGWALKFIKGKNNA